MLRLTGMDLKIEQYKKGERFVRAIADRRGSGRPDAALGGPRDAAARRRDRGSRALDRPRPRRSGGDDRGRLVRRAGPGSRAGPAPRRRSPSARSCRPATGRATSSASARPRRAHGSSRSRSRASPTGRSTTSRSCSAAGSARTRSTGSSSGRRGCRWVHSATSGVERALTPAALERGIVVTNARGVFSRPIAEYVLMMILAVSRRLPQLLELQRERTWQPLEGAELRDVTVGIVGLGSIGRAVGALATAFGCRVVAVRRRAEADAAGGASAEDEAAARRAHARPGRRSGDAARAPRRVRLHRPRGAADARDRGHDQRRDAGAWSSPARGSSTSPVAGSSTSARCCARCATATIGGAVLDTFRDEPLPPMSSFYDLPNVIVTPHTAWSSGRVLDRSVELFCDNLRRFAAGRAAAQRGGPERRVLISGDDRATCRSPSSGLPDRARRPSSTP